jgi:4a-hydroxytetrahydrobiopterin dehydratase
MSSSTTLKPLISKGSSSETILANLQNSLLPPHSYWSLTRQGTGIQRTFKFKTFKAAWSFMDRVAAECKTARHHPEWANVYNTVFIRWTTHEPKGLSEKDVRMAGFCDECAGELGVLAGEVGEVGGFDGGSEAKDEGDGVEALADGLARSAGDCCVPKKKGAVSALGSI